MVVSYDDPSALKAYITATAAPFTLLSDRDSKVIRQYGIFNESVLPGDIPIYGIPYPGSYVANEQGRVIYKTFLESYKCRENPQVLIDAALGQVSLGDPETSKQGGDEAIRVRVGLLGGAIKQGAQRRIVVRFEMGPGLHLYGKPVPAGMVPVEINVKGPEGLVVQPPILPATTPHWLQELNLELAVWTEQLDVQIPIYALSKIASELQPLASTELTLEVSVRYQACNQTTCLLPRTEQFVLTIPVDVIDVPQLSLFAGNGQKTLKFKAAPHIMRLVWRIFRLNPVAFFKGLARQRDRTRKARMRNAN